MLTRFRMLVVASYADIGITHIMPTPRLCRIKEFGIDRSLFFSRTCAANNLYTCGIIFACSDTSRAVASREQEECSAYLCRPLHIVTLSAGLRASRESLELCRVQASVRPVVAGVVLSMRHNPSVGIMVQFVWASGILYFISSCVNRKFVTSIRGSNRYNARKEKV